jgi:hypothetical protein
MRFTVSQLVLLLLVVFGLGWFSYREFEKITDPSTIYLVPEAETVSFLGGDWAVADVSGSTESTLIGKDTAFALVGKNARFKDHHLAFDDMDCPASMGQSVEPITGFIQDYGVTPFLIHMHMPARRIDAGCADVYPLAHDMILISYEGYFLEAVRRQDEPVRVLTLMPQRAHREPRPALPIAQ